jgi:hypothetical protein
MPAMMNCRIDSFRLSCALDRGRGLFVYSCIRLFVYSCIRQGVAGNSGVVAGCRGLRVPKVAGFWPLTAYPLPLTIYEMRGVAGCVIAGCEGCGVRESGI